MKTGMKKMICPECGSEARVVRGMWKFQESGLRNVVLSGVEIISCKSCESDMPIIPNVNDLMSVLALALVSKPYKLTGKEVRYLRKHIGMTQDMFSRQVKVDKTTVSKWENADDPVGPQSDLLIRYIVLAHDKQLHVWLEEAIQKFQEVTGRPKAIGIEINSNTMRYQYA